MVNTFIDLFYQRLTDDKGAFVVAPFIYLVKISSAN